MNDAVSDDHAALQTVTVNGETVEAWLPPPPTIPGLPDHLRAVPNRRDGAGWRERHAEWRSGVLDHRERLAKTLAANPTKWEAEIERVRRYGPKYFATAHLNVYEPRTDAPYGKGYLPFILLPFQVSYLDHLATPMPQRTTRVCRKPREVGITTGGLTASLWAWLFEAVWEETYLSRIEDLVDRADDKGSILMKLRLMIAHCPDPFLPPQWRGYSPYGGRFRWSKHLNITNPQNGNSINGYAATKSATRGDRRSRINIDEYAFWSQGATDTLTTALGTSHDVNVYSSTSQESNKDFDELVATTAATVPRALYVIDEDDHPAWHAAQTAADEARYASIGEIGAAAYQRERKGVSDAGLTNRYYPTAMDIPLTGLPIDPNRPVYRSHDPGRDGDYAISLFQERTDGFIDLVYGWHAKQSSNASYDAEIIAPLLVGMAPSNYTYTDRDIDFASVIARCRIIRDFGDPFGDQKNQGEGWYRELDKHAQRLANKRIIVTTRPARVPGVPHVDVTRLTTRIDATRRLIRRMRCFNHPYAVEVLRALREHSGQRINPSRPRIAEAKTLHVGDPSHYAQSVEFLAVHLDREGAIAQATAAQATRGVGYASPHRLGTVPTVPIVRR